MKVVVVDSGYYSNDEMMIKGISIRRGEKGYYADELRGEDELGHGTLVTNLIREYTDSVELFIVNIYCEDVGKEREALIYALNYIYKNVSYDIVQISLGVLNSTKDLMKIVNKLADRGLVIASFDNQGGISYPAAYSEVLGIDVTNEYRKTSQFTYVEDEVVDIRGANVFFRTKSKECKRKIVKGSSFYASYITAMLCNHGKRVSSKTVAKSILKKNAYKIVKSKRKANSNKKLNGNKAIILPFNKEISVIANNEDLLLFDIYGYYDSKYKGLVGKKIKDILPYSDNEKIIQDIEKINWEANFDTVICGHLLELERLVNKNIKKHIIKKCKKYKKNLFTFDTYGNGRSFQSNILTPQIDKKSIPENRFGKLRKSSVPTLCVMGTSSKQGKFSFLLKLKREFSKRGYKVGGISTEPTGHLFGFDKTFPYGYNSEMRLNDVEIVQLLNEYVWEIEQKDVDLIISSGQSGSITYEARNIRNILSIQHSFLIGINPDAVILIINSFDDVNYINKTISFFKSLGIEIISIIENDIINEYSMTRVKGNLSHFSFETELYSELNIEKICDRIIEFYKE